MSDWILSASILSANFAHLEKDIRTAESAGIDWVHIDVMDGSFVPNITMGPFIVSACRQMTTLPLDVHLMIDRPERHIQAFAKAGASLLSIHVEGNSNLHRTLQEIRDLGCKAGVVVNPGTPIFLVEPVLHLVDLVLVMSVNPGYSGQVFQPAAAAKIKTVASMCQTQGVAPYLHVDGGITPDTLPIVRQAGANAFVSATAIFHHPGGIEAGIAALRGSAL